MKGLYKTFRIVYHQYYNSSTLLNMIISRLRYYSLLTKKMLEKNANTLITIRNSIVKRRHLLICTKHEFSF